MKKIMAILCAAALALSLSSVAFAADKNLALDAEAVVDSVNEQYADNVAENLNDGDNYTRWQSNAKMTEADPCWGGLKWDEAQTIKTITVYWEAARPAEDGVKVQISNDGNTWTDVEATKATRAEVKIPKKDKPEEDETLYKDVFTLKDAATAKYVRLYCTKGQEYGDKGEIKDIASMWELEVYGAAAGGEQGGADTGVASTVAFAVVAMSAAAVAFTSKKKA